MNESIDLLHCHFGLTPSEARLALHLVTGETLRSAAAELHISYETGVPQNRCSWRLRRQITRQWTRLSHGRPPRIVSAICDLPTHTQVASPGPSRSHARRVGALKCKRSPAAA
jgi:hypothetical protein